MQERTITLLSCLSLLLTQNFVGSYATRHSIMMCLSMTAINVLAVARILQELTVC